MAVRSLLRRLDRAAGALNPALLLVAAGLGLADVTLLGARRLVVREAAPARHAPPASTAPPGSACLTAASLPIALASDGRD